MIEVETDSNRRSKLAYRSITARFRLRMTIHQAANRAGLPASEYERFELGLPSSISNREFRSALLQLEWEITNHAAMIP